MRLVEGGASLSARADNRVRPGRIRQGHIAAKGEAKAVRDRPVTLILKGRAIEDAILRELGVRADREDEGHEGKESS